ncbi:hypothetical protein TruAng_012027 [Truncatella angustata]|nr:hypothetical protein TruAng_012027 [Truncatella angustata]
MENIYRPLPQEGSTRLLVIEPCVDANQVVACQLTYHNFGQQQKYEALSYTWGNEGDVSPLLVDGKRFLARRNLVKALSALRYAAVARVVWVDAICINQHDVVERKYQISQMKDIYSRAQSVIIWLGEPTAASDLGMEMVRTISARSHEPRHGDIVKVGSTLADGTAKKTMSIGEFRRYYKSVLRLFNDTRAVRALDESVRLLDRPWWTRMWTLQESILCREVMVYCGMAVVPLEFFFDLAYFIFFAMNFSAWPGAPVNPQVAVREVWRIADLRDHIRERGYINLLLALDSSWNRMASDPRDKVNGLLGLIRPVSQLKPDISSTTAEIYQRTFIAAGDEENSLSFLGFISEEHQLRNLRLPTWVPDLELHSRPGSDYLASLSKSIFNRWVYDASLSRTRSYTPLQTDNNGSVLVLSGVEVDTVATIASQAPGKIPTDNSSSWIQIMGTVLDEWRGHMHLRTDYVKSGEPSALAFWRCVLVDLKQGFLHENSDPGKPVRMDEADYPSLSAFDSDEARHQLLAYWAKFCGLGSQMRLIEQFHRRFFVSETGYIGLGPPWLQQKDKICVLLGGSVPYALRMSNDGTWTYVGEW